MLASLDAALRPATAFRESTGTSCTHVITGVGSLRRMQCRQVVVCNAGFSGRSRAKSQKKEPKLARLLQEDGPSTSKVSDGIDGWIQLEDVHPVSSFLSKPIKPVILKTGRAICLYKVDDAIYCSAANSTAYQYPLADANLITSKGKVVVESKLDGTQYDLKTGKVVTWCPKNNTMRALLGTLKDKSEPVDLPVYPTRVDGDFVFVKLSA